VNVYRLKEFLPGRWTVNRYVVGGGEEPQS